MEYFLPLFRLKINSALDLSSLIRSLKESRDQRSGSKDTEKAIWEEIKIVSFALVFVTSYVVSSISVIFQVQLYLLATRFHSHTTEVIP